MQPLISLRGVTKEYKNQDIPALSKIDLTIYPGEFLAITGQSGSGKSTLLNILGLLTSPDSGTYTVKGTELGQLTEKQRDALRSHHFGFIFQSSHVLGYETVAKNAMLGLRLQNRPLEERLRGAETWVEKVGLGHRSDARGNQLSGGERQRLAIARAMATDPAVLLADEPTGNLDSQNAQLVFEQLKAINATGTTVVLITHDAHLASQVPRQVVLHDGVITKDETVAGSAPGKLPETVAQLTTAEKAGQKSTPAWVDDALDALNYISLTPFKALTLIFAFMLGIGGLVAAQGLSQSASHQVSQTIATAALDDVKADISVGETSTAYEGKSVSEIKTELGTYPGVRTVTAQRPLATGDLLPRLLPFETSRFSGSAYAVDSDYFTYLEAPVSHRQALWQLDGSQPVAFVGRKVAEELGIGNPNSGNGVIWLGEKPVTVLGFVEANERDLSAENNIYLNLSFGSLAGTESELLGETTFALRTAPGYPAPLAEALPYIINAGAPETVKVSTVGDLRNVQRGVSSNLSSLISGISWLLILLASLTSATTLYTSVQARRSEIALRRAIGASKVSVLRMFLFEGTFFGLAGGIAGASLGVLSLVLICLSLGWVPLVSMGWMSAGVLMGAVTGMVSAAYPAYLAAQAQPAEAIRA